MVPFLAYLSSFPGQSTDTHTNFAYPSSFSPHYLPRPPTDTRFSRLELREQGSNFWSELFGSASCLSDGFAVQALSFLVKARLEALKERGQLGGREERGGG